MKIVLEIKQYNTYHEWNIHKSLMDTYFTLIPLLDIVQRISLTVHYIKGWKSDSTVIGPSYF